MNQGTKLVKVLAVKERATLLGVRENNKPEHSAERNKACAAVSDIPSSQKVSRLIAREALRMVCHIL